MLSETELLYTLALQRVKNLGDISAKKLLRTVGSAEGIFKEKKHSLLKIDGIGSLKLKGLSIEEQLPAAQAELQFIKQNNIVYTYFLDPKYPEKLKHCLDGPIILFENGNIDLKNRKIISIVGTRKVTTYGTSFCQKLIETLAPLNPVIVSGFAYGVDITAHKAAMDCGLQTVACLAHGLNQIYPKSHKKHVTSVEENGGFLTEFWSDDPFDRNNFLKRNRIIAGVSEATIVIESAEKGGSLVTADIANSYNRDVFAVPGRATDTQSQGCNNLIKSNQAHLLNSAEDLIYMLGWELEEPQPLSQQKQLFVEFTPEEQKVFDYLNTKQKELLDTIALECGLPTFKVATLLLNLELKGVVRPLPGKLFEVI
ncbi:DNA-processing protein DprA [Marinirhabdus gelatinilytica]|uniref:DNA processing protein n=1 Tax=Marinirhabdus gelatinilytica TaxID=1703343 RepID=A0A370QJN5_9FLAO|nr:DNA-processing protein DprA [Marinirhabdus gelatinilytica]RDK88561.1 DNA processing protein [Marinirhabdus gelatinilytica]